MAENNLRTGYQQLISSYQAIDNFRLQLLARQPVAAGRIHPQSIRGKNGKQ
ncbi:MAG TPA: hypothetical protein VK249_13845 [Anaerolineales bacterium]|nr:hypothetical protein [Anaerolineales bacterium]